MLIVLFILGCGYIAYAMRYPLAAKIWHLRHGYATKMGDYEMPVPEHWLITEQDSIAFTMLNTAPNWHRDGKFHTTAVMTIFPFRNRPLGTSGLDFWVSLKRQRLEREKVKSVEEKRLNSGDDTIVCIGGSELKNLLQSYAAKVPDMDIISLECKTANDLNILFIGEPSDVQPFYALVSQIHRYK